MVNFIVKNLLLRDDTVSLMTNVELYFTQMFVLHGIFFRVEVPFNSMSTKNIYTMLAKVRQLLLGPSARALPLNPTVYATAVILACRKLKQPAFLESSNPPAQPAPRKQPIHLPKEEEPTPASPTSPPVAAAAYEEEEEAEELYDEASGPVPQQQEPAVRSMLGRELPPRPPSDDEEEDDQNWEGQLLVYL